MKICNGIIFAFPRSGCRPSLSRNPITSLFRNWSLFWGRFIVKPGPGQRISSSEIYPNLNVSRTVGDPCRRAFMEYHLHTPKLKIWTSAPDVLLEIGPGWRRLRLDRGQYAGVESGPEVVNPTVWGGEASRGPAHVEKIPCAKRRGRQLLGISVFQQADPHNFKTGVS